MVWTTEKPANDIDSLQGYEVNSREREILVAEIAKIEAKPMEIPLIINGEPIKTRETIEIRVPHNHHQIIARASLAGKTEIQFAIESALQASLDWSRLDWYHRSAIFKRAAHILGKSRRIENIAAIMVNQSKTPYQAEIDLAEMVDFLNFNAKFLQEIYELQPNQAPGEHNRFDWRPLEGFLVAISPFNFYSIGGNLPTAPAIAGNVVLWKPARSVLFSNFKIMEALMEAGIPKGVINFIPFKSEQVNHIFSHPMFAGIHFTGSYPTFLKIWQHVTNNLPNFRNFPRIIGETGGKNFILMHNSADALHTAMNILRGAFEYQGQKCSACSRVYIPESRWREIKILLKKEGAKIKYGDVKHLDVAGGAIISSKAYKKITSYIEFAKNHPQTYDLILGGNYSEENGWFIEPTIIITSDPKAKLMQEEIFGPVLTLYVYPDNNYLEMLQLIDNTSPYALTGSIFSKDRYIIKQTEEHLRYAAGNFYINDKPTGAVVGRQPFGGARASGTNDKAGSKLNLFRWLSPRTIKENKGKIKHWQREFMEY